MANSRVYLKSEAGGTTVVSRDTTAASGNLVLPASGNVASVDTVVTDNAIARYDGTTGKLQNSGVVIDDVGNIGIGTSNPRVALDIRNKQVAIGGDLGSAGDGDLYIYKASSPIIRLYDNIHNSAIEGGAQLKFSTFGSERMRIDSAGNVGIGTNAATKRLEVTSRYGFGDPAGNGAAKLANTVIDGIGSTDTTLIANGISGYYGSGFVTPTSTYASGIKLNAGDGSIGFYTNSGLTVGTNFTLTERARVDSSGNLGIGTSSVGARLHIKQPNDGYTSGLNIQSASNAAVRLYIGVDNATATTVISNDNHTMKIESTGANPLTLGTNGVEKMRIDPSGNIGIGFTPYGWLNSKSLDISGYASFSSEGNYAANVSNNAYSTADGVWKYKTAGYQSAMYRQGAGVHEWKTAPNGTAGNTISWTNAMTLDASGNLGIGTSSPSAKFEVQSDLSPEIAITSTSGATSNYLNFKAKSHTQPIQAQIKTSDNGNFTADIVFSSKASTTSGVLSEKMRIDSSGNVGIGFKPSTSYQATLDFGWGKIGGQGGSLNSRFNAMDTDGINASSYYASGAPASKFTQGVSGFLWYTAPSGTAGNAITWKNAMTLDTSGNLLLTSGTGALGYGTGAGGTVTQLTSKSTAVTLNKPSGEIVMNNAILASGATVAFTLNNSLIGVNDVLIISIGGAVVDYARYNAWSIYSGSGYTYIYLKNIYTSSLGEAVSIRFAIVKGANS